MDKKSKVLLWVLALLIVGSVAVTYWRIMIKKDYVIENQVDCDPYEKACFVWKCDPNSTVEGEACVNDPEKDIWYYAVAKRNAANVPLCDPDKDETCDPWTCQEGEKDCSETLCDDTNKEEQGVECNDSAQYTLDNPVEEEAVECEEGDEECLASQAEETTCEEGDAECEAPATDDSTADENSAENTDAPADDSATADNSNAAAE